MVNGALFQIWICAVFNLSNLGPTFRLFDSFFPVNRGNGSIQLVLVILIGLSTLQLLDLFLRFMIQHLLYKILLSLFYPLSWNTRRIKSPTVWYLAYFRLYLRRREGREDLIGWFSGGRLNLLVFGALFFLMKLWVFRCLELINFWL